jgi:hypothetical protein
MDVTQEIQRNHIIYGASDYTAPSGLAASKSLNYADGPSIIRPAHQELSVIPHTFRYQSEVGLFGAENYFSKIQLNIERSIAGVCFEEPGWRCALIREQRLPEEPYWEAGIVDYGFSCSTENTYECPIIKGNELPEITGDAYVSVDLIKFPTGNQFNDKWVDVRLYTKSREEHPYDRMWVKEKDFFYLGIHARNTRRLPFNVACIIGAQYADYNAIPNKDEIMKR